MGLDRQRITNAALDLLDLTGVDGLTMRKLAEALNVQAPALYWHFAGKPALLEDMAEALLFGVSERVDTSVDYKGVLAQTATELRRALLSRRDGARVFAGTFVARPNVLSLADKAVASLLRSGVEPLVAANVVFSLVYFVLGFVIEEQASIEQDRGGDVTQPSTERLLSISAETYPHVFVVLPSLIRAEQDERFNFGVDLILRGIKIAPEA